MHFEKFDLVGYRKKIGAIAPSTNTIAGPELSYLCPTGVSINFSDIALPRDFARAGADFTSIASALRENLDDCIDRVANREPHIVILAVDEDIATGDRIDNSFAEHLKARIAVPIIDPLTAIAAAVKVLESHNIALISPYSREQHKTLIHHFKRLDIPVVKDRPLNCPDLPSQARLSYKTLRYEAMELASGADAIVQLGPNLALGRVSEAIENDTGVPVIAINQALLWCAIRTLGVTDKIPGVGELLNRQSLYPE